MKKGGRVKLEIVFLIAVLLALSTYGFGEITPTHADGMIVYSQDGIQTPRFRTWNQSNDFSSEQSAQDIGQDITWIVTKANHKRNEIIVGTEDKDKDVNIQIFDSNNWGNRLEISDSIKAWQQRGFDIAVEQTSGDVLIVYDNSDADDNIIAYRTWDGTNYSAEQTITTSLGNSAARWISLTSKRNSDNIMLLALNDAKELYAILWNGTGFDTIKESVLSTDTISDTEQHFAFAWEEQSGEGLVVYGEGNDLVYRTYNPITGFNAIENKIDLSHGLDAVRMCSEPESDYIGIIWQDSGNDVQARIWYGDGLLANPPAEEDQTEANGANNINVDCAWINSSTALFGFIDDNELSMDYAFFTKANTWSTNDLTSTYNTGNFATDDIKSLRFTKHPTTEEIMITAIDIKEDISAIKWDGTNFVNITASPIEDATEVSDGAQEAAMFDWCRYDSPPNIISVVPINGSSFNISNIINITANVEDNLAVDTVLANITLANGAAEQLILLDADGDGVFSALYTIPAVIGNYNITFTASDANNNIKTANAIFNVSDVISPTITLNNPANNFNTSSTSVIFSFTATDDYYTILNCSLELNGAVNQINSSTQNGILTLFTVMGLAEGNHQWNINCNDGSDNLKISETRNFIVDITAPNISSLTTIPNSIDDLNPGVHVNVFANATDILTAVHTIILQQKLNNETTYTNQTMVFDSVSGLYNATFNAGAEGIYNLRIWAKDIVGNSNFGSIVNLTVEEESSPSTTPPIRPGGGGAGTSSAGTSSGSATGGVGGMAGGPVIEQEGEAVYSTARLMIPRGMTKTIPIRLTNHHENAVLENVKINIIGLNPSNIKITPKINPELKVYTETKTLKLRQGESDSFDLTEIGTRTIKVENASWNSARIILDYKSMMDSKPIEFELNLNETKNIDLNDDGINDAAIHFKEIKNNTINLKIHKISSPDPKKIQFEEEREYQVSIFIPEHMKKQELNAKVRITANIVPVNPELAGFESKPLTEYRTLLIKIIEKTEEQARTGLEKAKLEIEIMKTAGFPITTLETFLEQAKKAYDEKDYDLTYELTEKITALKKQAFETDKIIKEVQEGIKEAGLKESEKDEIEESLLLSQLAFETENFETALKKAKEAEKRLLIATKGELYWFLTNYGWAILLGAGIILIAFLIYKKRKNKKNTKKNKIAIIIKRITSLAKKGKDKKKKKTRKNTKITNQKRKSKKKKGAIQKDKKNIKKTLKEFLNSAIFKLGKIKKEKPKKIVKKEGKKKKHLEKKRKKKLKKGKPIELEIEKKELIEKPIKQKKKRLKIKKIIGKILKKEKKPKKLEEIEQEELKEEAEIEPEKEKVEQEEPSEAKEEVSEEVEIEQIKEEKIKQEEPSEAKEEIGREELIEEPETEQAKEEEPNEEAEQEESTEKEKKKEKKKKKRREIREEKREAERRKIIEKMLAEQAE